MLSFHAGRNGYRRYLDRLHRRTIFMTRKMRSEHALDISPPVNRSMAGILDKSAFRKSVPILAARVSAAKTGQILNSPQMRGSLLNVPRVRSVVMDKSHNDADRLVLLRVQDDTQLKADSKQFLESQSAVLQPYNLELDYDYWTADDILNSVLPEELCAESPSGFAVVGHIAHLNLNDEYLPHKHLIGQVILDKNPRLRTVVNKVDTIDNQFRVFKMEVIAGDPDFIVEHHESNCRFTFDFSEVYWNSRLHTEHDRLIQLFQPEDVVVDVFAGVGPFAIPAAKKGCAVLANDLNPSSAKYLSQNVRDNKVASLVRVSCEDGRDFIRAAAARAFLHGFPPYSGSRRNRAKTKEALRRTLTDSSLPPASPKLENRRAITHFVMNLPDSAITFLDAFRGILSPSNVGERDLSETYGKMPMIHCYCFTRELETKKAENDILQRVGEKLGRPVEDFSLYLVRSVAPNKEMYCISFRLPREVAFAR